MPEPPSAGEARRVLASSTRKELGDHQLVVRDRRLERADLAEEVLRQGDGALGDTSIARDAEPGLLKSQKDAGVVMTGQDRLHERNRLLGRMVEHPGIRSEERPHDLAYEL